MIPRLRQLLPGTDHPLTRLDARVKLLAALVLLVMVVSHRGVLFPLLTAGLGIAVCLWLGVRPRQLLIRFAEPLFLALVILLLKGLGSGEAVLWSGGPPWLEVTLHRDGLLEGVRIAGRIMGAVAVVAAVGFATPFTELLAALSWLRCPRGLIETTLFAWRYLFVLADDAQVIHAAQRNRLGYVGVARSCRSLGTLVGALVIKSFDSSQTMTVAMVQRGYDGTLPLLRHRPLRGQDVAAALMLLAVMGAAWSMLLA
jgi:cobalt/nickel transport system permease protein